MLVLDEAQMRWVSGGAGNDNDSDIVVEGERPDDDDDDWPEDPPRDPWEGEEEDDPYTPAPPPPPPPEDDYCAKQEAMQAAEEIERKNNDQNKEWGSIIYKTDDGHILHSPPLGGVDEVLQLSVFTDWLRSNSVDWSRVVGMVHNHPSNVYGGSQQERDANRYPSNHNTSERGDGDWGFAHYAVQHGASASEFSLFINDTRGTLREFTYGDRAKYENMSANDMANGRHLPRETKACGA